MINPKKITVRPSTLADADFLKDSLSIVIWGKDIIIEFDHKPIGLMLVNYGVQRGFYGLDRPTIVVSNIEILPEYRNQGIGTAVLNNVLLKAREQQMPVVLYVDKDDLSPLPLYERLGFAQEKGFTPSRFLRMVWRAEDNGFAPIRRMGSWADPAP